MTAEPTHTANPASVLEFLNAHLDDQIAYIKRLVEQESPSTEPSAQRGVFTLLSQELRQLGYRVDLLKGRHSGGRLFARPAVRRKGSPGQLLLGHADTVWPIGTLQKMPLMTEGNTLRGPGVFDMKAGLSQIVFALRALHALHIIPEVTPLVYVSSDEEMGSEDSRYNLQWLARRVIRVLIPEPAEGPRGRIKTSRKGVGLFQIRIEGREAHAGLDPGAGISAIVELAHVVQALHRLNDFDNGVTVTVGTVRGGSRPNVVPAEALAEVDVRTRTIVQAREVEAAIRGLSPSLEGAGIHVEGGIDRPPLEPTPRNRALWETALSCAEQLGIQLEECESGGGSDGNLTSPFTATLDGLGAVGGGAHARHEFIRLDRLVERTALLALLIAAPPAEPA